MTLQPEGSDSSLSLWIDTSPGTGFPQLTGALTADVAIVGGGITGITAAYLLARAGRSVVLVEKGRIAMSETGHTTAHIVSATDADYRDLVRAHGEANARLDSEAIRSSIDLVEQIVRELGIDCGLRTVDGYLYAEKEEHRSYLERQRDYLAKAGVATEWTDAVPLPFPTIGGLRFRGQRAFHPRLYLLALADAAVKGGARFFESSLVTEVENGDGARTVRTANGSVAADHVILATHVPLNDRGGLWAKMTVTRTYVVAAPIEAGRVPDALFWDTEDPYHYTRLAEADGKTLLIVGGEDRDVGTPENDEERYRALEQYCRDRYRVTEFAYRWSGQINEPADALPFIGESAHGKKVWTSTGYSGTGMTYGTLAAMLLADLALGRENRFAKLYDPSRTDIRSVARNVVEAAGTITKRLVEKVTGGDVEAPADASVAEGEGKIAMRGGRKVAVSKIDGAVRALDPTCTHMGCTVAWNAAEKSWDCPCHGSRFDVSGRVLNGPATKALKTLEEDV